MPDTKGFDYGDILTPNVFIQWKGTDVCMDFNCECGASLHFDGYHAYAIKCTYCKTIWEIPWNLFPRKASKDYDGNIVEGM